MRSLGPGPTLSVYIATTFARWIGGIFLIGAAIIYLADAVELIRRTSDRPGFDAGAALLASLLKVPSLTEEFLPFAVLFGAIAAFVALNRRLELAVMRAAGISVWQFVLPAAAVAAGVGIVATTLYNPLSAAARETADTLAADLLGHQEALLSAAGRSIWFRQNAKDGGSIVHAAAASADGRILSAVEVHLVDAQGRFAGRMEAASASLKEGAWRLFDVSHYAADGRRTEHDTATVPTVLTPVEVREAVAQPEAISFWRLPAAVAFSQRAGLPAHRFRLQHQVLLARPLLLAAMVVIAASVSLKMLRLGGLARAVSGGVAAGFTLYLAAAVTSDLGEAGAVPPVLAAWLPGVAAGLFGVRALLSSEDG